MTSKCPDYTQERKYKKEYKIFREENILPGIPGLWGNKTKGERKLFQRYILFMAKFYHQFSIRLLPFLFLIYITLYFGFTYKCIYMSIVYDVKSLLWFMSSLNLPNLCIIGNHITFILYIFHILCCFIVNTPEIVVEEIFFN